MHGQQLQGWNGFVASLLFYFLISAMSCSSENKTTLFLQVKLEHCTKT